MRRALARAIELGEVGVAVAAYSGDELIVDEWAGLTAERGGLPVEADTLFSVFSVTKAITATALHLQAERGLVDYQAPIATYWPEFGQAGKHGHHHSPSPLPSIRHGGDAAGHHAGAGR